MHSGVIGRQRELAALAELAEGGGVVTLIGPGGVGKTRLAMEFAERHQQRTGDAVTTATLASVPAGASASLVADALGFESVDAATVVIAQRGGLVVLDNCEHVIDGAREVASAIGNANTLVVATSREPLGMDDERVMIVEPLALPGPGGADAEQSAAVALFLERAASAGAVLDPSPTVLADVAELCRRLDGLPLAIELAAARTRGITPGDLLAAVDKRLDLLRRARPTGARHDSMRAAIEVSMGLLAPSEQAFFRRLAVFTGPFEVGVAHAVAAEPGSERLTTLEALAGLVDRSLVTAEAMGSVTRYRLLELLREHALGELTAAGELADVEERFVEAMIATADGIVASALSRWDPVMLGSASSQYPNLVRAVELCLQRDATPDRAYRLLLPMFAAVHEGRPNEVWALGRRVLERWPDASAPWRAEVLAVLATAAAIAGRHADVVPLAEAVVDDPAASAVAQALADRAWGLAARTTDPADAARHFELARIAAERAGFASMALEVAAFRAGELDLAGETDEALVVLAGVLADAEEAGDVFASILAHLVSCRIRLRAGELDEAAADHAVAHSASAAMGQPWWTAAILRTWACLISLGEGGWAGAAPYWRQAVDFAASHGALGEVAITLRTAATVAHHLGELEAAEVLCAAVPRSTAITVLPELFPGSARALAARATPGPQGTNLLAALRTARAALGDARDETPDEPAAATEVPVRRDVAAELVLEGDVWRWRYAERSVRIRDMKGIGDLAVLLARPRVEVHALELMGGADVGGAAGPALDDVARRKYQDRIVELQREIDDARADHDVGRAEHAEVELDALVEQLSEAFGLGGRSRTTGSSAERARTAVTYRVRAAIRRIAEVHPDLGRHLTNAVKTGTWCSYQPETDVVWTIERRSLTL
jgi:predicted ATPase